ncbi:MAG: alanine:cation symporter family protein [Lachnospiraceae bacterium]|nr:alanine:cation symporter family protein [Lachnospiraceae bacterium]
MLEKIDDYIWGPGMLFLLLGTGSYLMLRLRGLPIKKLGYALLCSVGREEGHAGNRSAAHGGGKGVSSFASLTTELAATIGTGNIVGVATAMVLGGPGALLWMMVSALIGMATKLVESMLSVKYRTINSKGDYVGGPMYTMARGIKCRTLGNTLGICFSAFAVLASIGMGNMTQANSIAEAFRASFNVPVERTGLIVTILTILVVLGGIGSISKVTAVLVPFMGIFYMLAAFIVIFTHIENVPAGISSIIVMAFCPRAVGGGICRGITVSMSGALRWGVARGVFSNEAGLGAAGISAAAAQTDDYVRQGLISMTGVFLDTIVICSVTGLAIAASGLLGAVTEEGGLLTGIALVTAVFEGTFGGMGKYFTAISIALFAFATIAGWEYQGEKAFEFLIGNDRYAVGYRFVYALSSFPGAVAGLEAVWTFSDICNGLMAVPNLICVLLLSGEAVREIRAYFD